MCIVNCRATWEDRLYISFSIGTEPMEWIYIHIYNSIIIVYYIIVLYYNYIVNIIIHMQHVHV